MKGKFYGVGVGPGDPELITLKGLRVLEMVDVVCSPRSAEEREGIALSVARQAVRRQFEVVELMLPMTRDRGELERHWEQAARRVYRELCAGRHVAFVTLGDPTFYSTYTYILKGLRRIDPSIEVETVPGVTAFSACAAMLNMPLAEGEEKLAVVPGIGDLGELERILAAFDNTVIMKAARRYDELVGLLDKLGLADRAVYVSRCGLEGEMCTRDLRSLVGSGKDYLSLMLVKRGSEVGS